MIVFDVDHPASGLTMAVGGYRTERAFTDDDVGEGLEPPPTTAVHWRDVLRGLQVGDELRIRIVEADEADEATETPQLPDPSPED